jgi:DNA-binding NtrC family response regulator
MPVARASRRSPLDKSPSAPDASDDRPRLDAHLLTEIDRLASSLATVLLLGGGSSVERARVARAVHERSNRREQPYAEHACRDAAVVEVVFRSPGSQRGASGALPGRGTLHLADVEELPLLLQPHLLGFLDEWTRPRVVVSTGADLAQAVSERRFRSDLAGRLGLVQLRLPLV